MSTTPGTSRALTLSLLGIGAALVAVLAWLVGADAGPGRVTDGPASTGARRGEAPAPADEAPAVEGFTPSESRPLDGAVGRLVVVDGHGPDLAYERTVRLQPDANGISTRVLDADGTPLAGARVALYEIRRGHHGEVFVRDLDHGVSDAAGRVTLAQNERDHFDAESAEAWRLAVLVEGRPRWHGRPVAAGAPADITLPPSYPASLTLRFRDGEPVAGAVVREHMHPLGDVRMERERIEPHWTLGVTDADGRLELVLAADHLRPLVRIEHPDFEGMVRLPESGPGGDMVLELTRDRSIEVEWTGDLAAYEARGVRLPPISLDHLDKPPARGGPSWTPERFEFTTRRDDATTCFEHLSDERLVLRRGWRGPALTDEIVPAPGRLHLALPLPPLDAFVPGTSDWGFTLSVASRGPHLGWRPHRLQARGADGLHMDVRLLSKQDATLVSTTLLPPVTVFFEDWGPDGPHVEGVRPGDVVELIVDGDTRLDWSAAIRVDTRLLDDERARGVKLRVRPAGQKQPSRQNATLVGGLLAGRYEYRVWGDGVERLEGEIELAPGDEHVLEPLPAPWPAPPVVDATPRDLREPHAQVVGTVTVDGEPWAFAERVRLIPLKPDGTDVDPTPDPRFPNVIDNHAETLRARGNAFRAAVPAGRYRVEVDLARYRWPRWGRNHGVPREGSRSLERMSGLLAEPVVIDVAEGDGIELDLTVSAEPAMGLLLVTITAGGEPAPTRETGGHDAAYAALWIDRHGEHRAAITTSLTDGVLEIDVPPGPGTLRVTARDDEARSAAGIPLGAGEVSLTAPAPYGAQGEPQALELTLDLPHVTAGPSVDGR